MLTQPYVIASRAHSQIAAWAAGHRYTEVGGLLVGAGRYIADSALLRNIHMSPGSCYQWDTLDERMVRRHIAAQDMRVIGYWHSHPDGPALPSRADRRQHRSLELIWDCTYSRARLWHLGRLDDGEQWLLVGVSTHD